MNVLRNVLWGVGQAACGVAACLVIVILATWGDHSLSVREFPGFVRFYVSMGAAAGLVLGLGRPLLSSFVGRGVVGFFVALPVFYVALFHPPTGDGAAIDKFSVITWLVISAFVGASGAAYITIRNQQRAKPTSRPDA